MKRKKNALIVSFLSCALLSSPVFAQDVAKTCSDGAKNALKGDIAVTGIICLADIFFTLGSSGVCAAKIVHSVTQIPAHSATGCAIAVALGGEGNPAYETSQTIGNVASGVEVVKTVVDIVQ